MNFANPGFLGLILLLLPLTWHYWRQQRRGAALRLSSLRDLAVAKSNLQLGRWLVHLGFLLRSAAVVFFVLALARPQAGGDLRRSSEGLDIMLTVDASGSMRAIDFEVEGEAVNRLVATKKVIEDFVLARPDDRIGMVVFGAEAFTQTPLTLDHKVLSQFLRGVKIGMAGDATAIGDAIVTATNRLKDIDAKNKIIVLLTDGENTAGRVEPMVAAKAAAAVGVRVYTIGIGRDGKVPVPMGGHVVYQELRVDEATLKEIAAATDAQYFRAYDTESLRNIYATIDKLEKRKIEVQEFKQYNDVFAAFVWPGLLLLFLELFMGITRWRRIP